MNNDYYKSPEPSGMMVRFWKAAGADENLLRESTYSDQVKYFCLGGIVIATGIMAAIAGGYAIYTVFEPKTDIATASDSIHGPTFFFACLFGALWGLIIFNIDRFIVAATGKGDGTEAITGKEIKAALPRLFMGAIIAFTISKPIEIRMFKSEVDAEIAEIQKEYLENLDSLTTVNWDSKIKPFTQEKDSLLNTLEKRRIEIQKQRRRLEDEAAGLLPPNPPGRGPAWRDKDANLRKMEAELKIKRQSDSIQIAKLTRTIEKYEKRKEKEFADNELQKRSKDGLLLRLQLSEEIAGPAISWFIALLFLVIELTPIFFKMMLIKGPYDYMDDNVRDLARAEAGIEIEYDFYADDPKKKGMERHKVVNHAAETKRMERVLMLKAQQELNERIVEEWKKKRAKEIGEDPDLFVN